MKPVFFLIFYLISLSSLFAVPEKEYDLLKQELQIFQKQNISHGEMNLSIPNAIDNTLKEISKKTITQPEKNGKSVNTITGRILMGENFLPDGDIYLLENSKGAIYSVEPETVTNGDFLFKNLKNGDYFFYVIPHFDFDVLYYPKYVPSYSGNTHLWEKSTLLKLDTSNCFLVNLVRYDSPFYGQKSITGKLRYSTGYMGIKDIPVPILLLNENKAPMDFRIADEFTGEYAFENLPEGIYFIHPEIPGIKTNDYKIIINDGENNDNINFVIEDNTIKPEDEDNIDHEITDDFIKITIDGKVSPPFICDLISASGLCVSKGIYNTNEIKIQTDPFNAGIYIIKIRTFDNSYIKTDKLYINNHL